MSEDNNNKHFVTTVQFKETVIVQGSTVGESVEDARKKVEYAFSEMDDVEILSLEEVSEEELMERMQISMEESPFEVAETIDPSKLN